MPEEQYTKDKITYVARARDVGGTIQITIDHKVVEVMDITPGQLLEVTLHHIIKTDKQ